MLNVRYGFLQILGYFPIHGGIIRRSVQLALFTIKTFSRLILYLGWKNIKKSLKSVFDIHIETSSLWAEFVNKNRCISVCLVSEEVKSIEF